MSSNSWNFELILKPDGELITEGPVWTGEEILFTHIRKNRILRYNPKTNAISVWRENTNRTNGLCFDNHGKLFGCCSGGRSIVRKTLDIEFEGYTYPERTLTVAVAYDFDKHHGYSYRNYISDPGQWSNLFK